MTKSWTKHDETIIILPSFPSTIPLQMVDNRPSMVRRISGSLHWVKTCHHANDLKNPPGYIFRNITGYFWRSFQTISMPGSKHRPEWGPVRWRNLRNTEKPRYWAKQYLNLKVEINHYINLVTVYYPYIDIPHLYVVYSCHVSSCFFR